MYFKILESFSLHSNRIFFRRRTKSYAHLAEQYLAFWTKVCQKKNNAKLVFSRSGVLCTIVSIHVKSDIQGTILVFILTSIGGHEAWKFDMAGGMSAGIMFETLLYVSALVSNLPVVLWNIHKYDTSSNYQL